MESRFHKLAVEIAFNAMPSEFREKFLDGFSIELLLDCADIPYVPTKFGEPEQLHLNHSYKLHLKGRDLHKVGDSTVLDDVVNFAKSIPKLAKENQTLVIKYNIAKATHYIIDIGTFPHVNAEIWDKYHTKYEELAADWLALHKEIAIELVKGYTPNPMKSVPNRVRAIAEKAFFDSTDYLPAFKRNSAPTDLQMANVCCKHIYDLMDWFSTFQKFL